MPFRAESENCLKMTENENTDLLIGYVLDKSSSMGGLTNATITGFNEFCESQRKEDGKTWLSLTLFSTDFDVRYVAWDLKDVPPMGHVGDNAYRAYGNTALYDAVGITIDGVSAWLKNNEWFQGKVLIVIWTDGGENSSDLWDLSRLNAAISTKQAEGWEFLFQGAGQSAWLESQKLTSLASNQVNVFYADTASTASSYAGSAGTASTLRNFGSSAARTATAAWQQDYNAQVGSVVGASSQVPQVTVYADTVSDATNALSGKPVHKGRTTSSPKTPKSK